MLSVSGSVARLDGGELSTGSTLDGDDWLELGESGKVSLRHIRTSREWTLLGAARVRPCIDGEEQLALASGTLRTSVGGGARPGAEVFVFTPFGTLRYGDATLSASVEPARLSVKLDAGDAWFDRAIERAPSSQRHEPSRPEPKKLFATESITFKPNPTLLEQRCARDAQAAAAIAEALRSSAPKDKHALSERAVAHLKARRAARLSCGEALAVAGRLEGEERGRLLDRLAKLERTWRSPSRSAGPKRPDVPLTVSSPGR